MWTSIKQGGKESPTVFNMVMRCWVGTLSTAWKERQGYKTRAGAEGEDDELLISHMIFTDNCFILASSRTMLLEMAQIATEKIVQCDLQWKTNERQYACWGSADMNGVDYNVPRVQEVLVVGSLLPKEADTMSAMGHRTTRC